MYPLFVATAVVLAAGTHHRVVSAGGMQLKHRSSVRVHGASRRAAIPHGLGNPTFCMGFVPETDATSQQAYSLLYRTHASVRLPYASPAHWLLQPRCSPAEDGPCSVLPRPSPAGSGFAAPGG